MTLRWREWRCWLRGHCWVLNLETGLVYLSCARCGHRTAGVNVRIYDDYSPPHETQ